MAIPGTVTLAANALPNLMPSFETEMQACQRYFQKNFTGIQATVSTAGVYGAYVPLRPAMRVTPSLSYSLNAGTNYSSLGVTPAPDCLHIFAIADAPGNSYVDFTYAANARF